jgi:hypothetical protein
MVKIRQAMSPPHIEALLQEQISTDLRVRGTSQRDVEQRALAEWSHKGGGLRPQVVKAQALLAEIGVRAEVISTAIRKVLQEVRVSPYNGLVDDLALLFESHYDCTVGELQPEMARYLGEIGLQREAEGEGRFGKKIEDRRAEHRMEVKRLGAAIMEPALRSSVISISVANSQVGAIQTGDYSVVGTGVAITNQDSTKLLEALTYLKEHLDAVQPSDESRREELREIIVDVESEVHKSKPNKSKLAGLLSMVLATIKNVDAVKTAYDTIVSVVGHLGIHLIT